MRPTQEHMQAFQRALRKAVQQVANIHGARLYAFTDEATDDYRAGEVPRGKFGVEFLILPGSAIPKTAED